MFRAVSCAVAALACAMMASPSNAQSFSPSSGTFTGIGNISLSQNGVTAICTLRISVTVVTPTYASVPTHGFAPGSLGACSLFLTWGVWRVDVVPGSTTEIDIQMGFLPFSACQRVVRAQWDNATQTAIVNGEVLPGPPSCTVSGPIYIQGLTIL